jgi:DNA-binding response OmpR family regulator
MSQDCQTIRVLLIEDDEGDFLLIREHLSEEKTVEFRLERVDRLSTAIELLGRSQFDIVLLDLGLPDSSGTETFDRLHEACQTTPVIILTGLYDEELAVKKMKSGAQDYMVKGEISGRLLTRSIRYAIERYKLMVALENSLREIKTLRGFLPICASCKKIRDDKGYWNQIEAYISKHSDAKFTHGICPECFKKLYPDYCDDVWVKKEKKEL